MFEKVLQVGFFIIGWFQSARRDRVIDFEEIMGLVAGLIEVLGVTVRIKIPSDVASLHAALSAMPGLKVEK